MNRLLPVRSTYSRRWWVGSTPPALSNDSRDCCTFQNWPRPYIVARLVFWWSHSRCAPMAHTGYEPLKAAYLQGFVGYGAAAFAYLRYLAPLFQLLQIPLSCGIGDAEQGLHL